MACPKCGCKVHYQYDDGDDLGMTDERLERCAACGHVFDIEDGADEDDDREECGAVPHGMPSFVEAAADTQRIEQECSPFGGRSISPQANLASKLIRPATVDDFMRLADVMAQRLAEYLYDHEDGKGKEAGDDYAAARDALKAALVSGVVEVTDGVTASDDTTPPSPSAKAGSTE